jgi:hypothetical protein
MADRVALAPLPQGVAGSDLVLQINDRLRRIALALGTGTAGSAGPAGPPGPPGAGAGVQDGTVGVTIDGAGSTPATGHKGYIQVPYAGTIVGWAVVADVVGSLTMEIDKKASSAPPAAPSEPNTTTDKISASAPVALAAAVSASAGVAGVSTWANAVAQWDVFGFNLTAAATWKRATVTIYIQKS